MSSRTCRSTKRSHAQVALGAAWLILVGVTAGSCVLGNDNDRPVLAVDPLWDVTPGDRFSGDSCDGAGVQFMTWEIQDDDGKSLKKSRDLEDCKPLDFIGLVPGTYQLVIAGYDNRENKLWEATCSGLELGRFDVLYPCEVDELSGSEGAPDAGVPTDAAEPDAG
jgi:hypothetical protein